MVSWSLPKVTLKHNFLGDLFIFSFIKSHGRFAVGLLMQPAYHYAQDSTSSWLRRQNSGVTRCFTKWQTPLLQVPWHTLRSTPGGKTQVCFYWNHIDYILHNLNACFILHEYLLADLWIRSFFRFSKPVPAGPWAADRVRDGTRDPPVCLQPDAIKLYDDSQACMISFLWPPILVLKGWNATVKSINSKLKCVLSKL